MISKALFRECLILCLVAVDLSNLYSHSGPRFASVAEAEGLKMTDIGEESAIARRLATGETEGQRKKVFQALSLNSPEADAFLSKFETETQKQLISSFQPGDQYGGEGLHAQPINDHQFTVMWFHGLAQPIKSYPRLITTILLDERILRHTKFIVPQAPTRVVTCFPYGAYPAWADMPDFHPRSGEDEVGWVESTNRMCNIIEGEAKKIAENMGISIDEAASRIAVGGVSQGGALAYSVTLRCPITPRSTIVVAGWIPLASQYPEMLSEGLKADTGKGNFLVLHGEDDGMVLPIWARLSFLGLQQVLTLNGKFVTYHGIDHEICKEEVEEIQQFVTARLRQVFYKTGKLRVTFHRNDQ